jgi:peptidoglycan L-alanyl-D-glutamate endopeptidase CwlK
MMDSVSEERLSHVHPKLAELVRTMAMDLALQGITIRVTQGLRTWDEQKALYEQGRSTLGNIVTNAAPGHSYHNFGLAIDVVPMTTLGPNWNSKDPVWQKIVAAGKAQGLVAGAEWRTLPDYPHFQLTGSLPVSPNEYVRDAYAQGGINAVWTAAGLFSETSTKDA